jgi:hypothetical protein
MRGGRTRRYNNNSLENEVRGNSRVMKGEIDVLLRAIKELEYEIIELRARAKKSRNPGDIDTKIERRRRKIQEYIEEMQELTENRTSWFGGRVKTKKRSRGATQKKRN